MEQILESHSWVFCEFFILFYFVTQLPLHKEWTAPKLLFFSAYVLHLFPIKLKYFKLFFLYSGGKISIPKLLLDHKSPDADLNPTISKMFRFSFEVKLKLLIYNICGPIQTLLMPIFPNGKHYET